MKNEFNSISQNEYVIINSIELKTFRLDKFAPTVNKENYILNLTSMVACAIYFESIFVVNINKLVF